MNRMKELREAKGITMKEAAALLQLPYTTYVNYEKSAREPNSETLKKIAEFYQTSIDYLLCRSDSRNYEADIRPNYSHIKNVFPMPEMKKLPLVGGIACGTPILAEQNIEDEIEIPNHIQADFVLRCNGDSMIGAWIKDGDYVCIRIQSDVDDGQIAAVLIDDCATLKRVYHQKNGITLMAENPNYPPMVFIGEECEDIRIMGKAVACISEIS